MTASNLLPELQKHMPVTGDMALKSPMAYKATRLMAGAVNATQMALAEAYMASIIVSAKGSFKRYLKGRA
jgi:cyclopropane-fatty-acyl-phospholipid synthase